MTTLATEGTCLAALVKLALPMLQQTEQKLPRTWLRRNPLITELSEQVSPEEKIDKLVRQVKYVVANSQLRQ